MKTKTGAFPLRLPLSLKAAIEKLAAPDGTMWYTGHMGSLLGHLDPKTGKITEYHTKTPISGPHGLTMDKDGNVWYTGNFKGYIGKLDVKTGQFTDYLLPKTTNVRRVYVDNTTTPVTFWVGSNHGASIVKVTPLD